MPNAHTEAADRSRIHPGITRRSLVKGTAAAAAAAAVVSILPGCTNSSSDTEASKPVSASTTDAVSILDSYEEADLTLSAQASWSFAPGNVLFAAEGSWLPVIATGETANPMCVARALSLTSGTLSDVVAAPITDGPNWAIFDARCSDKVYAWVEMDTITRDWKLYASAFSEGVLTGTPTTLWESNSDYAPPKMACTASKVFWLVMPSLLGSKTTEHSYCYLWKSGSKDAKAVVESPGRFAAEPSISEDTITLAPRVDEGNSNVYYGLTCYSLDDDLETTIDQLVLPASISPFRATHIGDNFVFSIEANYDSGGLFGNMGTYIGSGDGPWVTLSREPAADVCGTEDGRYIIKSRSSYFVVNVPEKTYAILSASNNCVDYGEYPASQGAVSTFCTFATIKDTNTGSPASVAVRTFGL